MNEEIFIPINGFEDLYHISNMGRVKILGSLRIDFRGVKKLYKEKMMIGGIRNGYKYVHLRRKKYLATYKIHALVARHFIENIHNKPHINHINGIKTDNRAENLEWCTPRENVLHALRTGLNPGKPKVHPSVNPLSKPVDMIDINTGKVIKTFTSMREAADESGVSIATICWYMKDKTKKKKNYDWRFPVPF